MAVKNRKSLGKGLDILISQAESSATGKEHILELDVSSIKPNPYQPRKVFAEDALNNLAASLAQHGLVQPITVRKVDSGYQIVAGERRFRAAQSLGWKFIPAIVKDYSTEETTEIALVENLQRQDLDPVEEAYAYLRLMESFKLTQNDIAIKVGRSRSHVTNMMRLLKLPIFIQNDLSAGELTVGQARPLLALPTEELQREALSMIYEKELNARQIESLVKQLLAGKLVSTTRGKLPVSAEVKALQDKLKVAVGSPVAIKFKRGKEVKGRIEIAFSSEKELDALVAFLEQSNSSSHEELKRAIKGFKV